MNVFFWKVTQDGEFLFEKEGVTFSLTMEEVYHMNDIVDLFVDEELK